MTTFTTILNGFRARPVAQASGLLPGSFRKLDGLQAGGLRHGFPLQPS
jgi:hypothetical protein